MIQIANQSLRDCLDSQCRVGSFLLHVHTCFVVSVSVALHVLRLSHLARFLFVALEGEGSKKSSSDRAGDRDGSGDANAKADQHGGLSGTIRELFAGRLMNYIEVS